MKWIKIEEKHPIKGERVIGYRPFAHEYGDETITVLEYEDQKNTDFQDREHRFERNHIVSHWMPLPIVPA